MKALAPALPGDLTIDQLRAQTEKDKIDKYAKRAQEGCLQPADGDPGAPSVNQNARKSMEAYLKRYTWSVDDKAVASTQDRLELIAQMRKLRDSLSKLRSGDDRQKEGKRRLGTMKSKLREARGRLLANSAADEVEDQLGQCQADEAEMERKLSSTMVFLKRTLKVTESACDDFKRFRGASAAASIACVEVARGATEGEGQAPS